MTETDLRWQLRQLPREIELSRDLWPAIAKGIGRPKASPHRPWLVGLSMAAGLSLAVGIAWRMAPSMSPTAAPGPDLTAQMLQREAAAMTSEYQAALRQFDGLPVTTGISADLQILDRGAEQIRGALAANPDSPALLKQLRKVYSRRLELTQRAAIG